MQYLAYRTMTHHPSGFEHQGPLGQACGLGGVVGDQYAGQSLIADDRLDGRFNVSLDVSSSAEVGSSSNRTSGELARVRATETRWASPPERLATLRLA